MLIGADRPHNVVIVVVVVVVVVLLLLYDAAAVAVRGKKFSSFYI